MPSSIQPIKFYGAGGPNPPKIAILLNELSLPHEIIPTPISDVKKPEYLALNPNGRLPTIQDPNTNITLWETGAIIEYLIERYDKDHKLSFPAGSTEAYHAKQWLFLQVSGQAPYYGQLAWFKKYHPEKVPSAVARYVGEVKRVTGVLDGWLKKQREEFGGKGDGPWLVGNKMSFADLAFVTWQRLTQLYFLEEEEFDKDEFPEVQGWLGKMVTREGVKKVLEDAGY